jgi:hypothetical protein
MMTQEMNAMDAPYSCQVTLAKIDTQYYLLPLPSQYKKRKAKGLGPMLMYYSP